jgi:hypothetical protein
MARPDSTVSVVTATVLLSIYSAAAAQTFVPPDLSIRAGDPQPFDGFGYGLAGEGANLLVGARGSDSTALNGGAIYAFSRVGASWQQVQKIVFPGAQQGDGIGEALAMAGAVGVAGAPRRGIGGSAFILRFDGGAWFPVTEVTDTSAGSGSEFGASVDCGADSVVIGAPSSSEGVGAFAGRVRVFRRDGVLWSSGEVLTAEFPDPGDRFGFAVAMDGGWLAVSAPGDDDGGVNAGAVWLYRESGGAFVLIEKLTPPGPSPANVECGFGQSICIDGSRLLVGAPRADLAGIDAGAVYRFNLGAKGASPVGVILPPGPAAACDFGFSVASLGQVAVIGAPGLTRDGQLSGGAFVCLDGATSDGVLTASTTGIGLVGARVALAGDSIIAAAPAMTVLTAGYAGQLIAIDRTRDCDQSGVPDGIEVAAGALIDGNQDGVPDACQCLPDLSGDGIVSGSDLALILGFWGTGGSATFDADITNDGIVNAEDLALVLGAWGPCPG